MTATPTTQPADQSPATSAEVLLQVDAATLVVGSNVRTDTHPDAKDFAASIRTRGVLEAITAYRDPDAAQDADRLVVLRGQRRTLVAATVGTPTGTVPVRVVPAPSEADRIVDQLTENLHRAPMHEAEVLGGVEQLALVGVSAAQIAKRTALKRATVDNALAVTRSQTARTRLLEDGLTLDQAALFAEFEDNPTALEQLARSVEWGRPLEHLAQRLRDEATERAEITAEATRLRDQGLPVVDPDEAPASIRRLRLDDLRTADGDPVPEADWPTIPGAVVVVVKEWQDPDPLPNPDGGDDDDQDASSADGDEDPEHVEEPEAVEVLVPVWICLDPAAAGLHHRWDATPTRPGTSGGLSGLSVPTTLDGEAQQEAAREQRRTVIANNKAWASAETVRRTWLAQFLLRKTPPVGAEALIAEALITGHHSLTKALDQAHPRLRDLLPHTVAASSETGSPWVDRAAERARLLARATTPKAATMLALGVVLAAWEDSTGKHTWRNPSAWDARIRTALQGWGYQPSDVELLLTGNTGDTADDLTADLTGDAKPDPGDDSGDGPDTDPAA